MTFGGSTYGSVAYAGEKIVVQCSSPSANLIVMENLLKVGYTVEEILMLYRYIYQT
jgi:hypothetical protein